MKLLFACLASVFFLGNAVAAEAPAQIQITARFKEQTKSGEDILNAPRVTTLSGRQAQIRVVHTMNILGVGAKDKELARADSPKGLVAGPVETGVTLDLLPMLKNGAIEYGGIATLREFIGYDGDAKNPAAAFVTRELHFFGTAKNGETKTLKFKAGGKAKDAELQLQLTFTLVKADGSPFTP